MTHKKVVNFSEIIKDHDFFFRKDRRRLKRSSDFIMKILEQAVVGALTVLSSSSVFLGKTLCLWNFTEHYVWGRVPNFIMGMIERNNCAKTRDVVSLLNVSSRGGLETFFWNVSVSSWSRGFGKIERLGLISVPRYNVSGFVTLGLVNIHAMHQACGSGINQKTWLLRMHCNLRGSPMPRSLYPL